MMNGDPALANSKAQEKCNFLVLKLIVDFLFTLATTSSPALAAMPHNHAATVALNLAGGQKL